MSAPQNFAEFQEQVSRLKAITEDQWNTYVEVRDKLAAASEFPFGDGEFAAARVAAAAGGGAAVKHGTYQSVVKCAMLGIHEPGQGTASEYDPAAVQRFAQLGG